MSRPSFPAAGRSSPTMRPMFAVVWHYWVGVAIAIGAVATLVAMVVGYLKTVESTRYPKGR
jgi:hypothetical protein